MKAGRIELELVLQQIGKIWQRWRGTTGQIDVEHRVQEYHRIWKVVAAELDAELVELGRDLWQIQYGGRKTRIWNYRLEFDNPVVLNLAARKHLVHRLVGEAGIPVPDHRVFSFSDLDIAYEFSRKYPNGCVVKPVSGYGGKGITTHVAKTSDVRSAAILPSFYSRELLIENQIVGECYRLLIIQGEMVHAVRRPGVRLVGNGRSTISRLLEETNVERRAARRDAINIDRDLIFTLRAQAMALDAIPSEGQTFLAKCAQDHVDGRREVRTIYTEEVTELIGKAVSEQAVLAAKILGSDFLGVDIITPDVTMGLLESGGVVNELNTTPGLHHHYDSKTERFPEPALRAIQVLLDDDAKIAPTQVP